MADSGEKRSFFVQVASLEANFWFACVLEVFERLAFFSVRAIAPLFLVASAGENGLGLNYTDRGIILGVWALVQCLVPMVSGGYTERYGYRISLLIAFTINIMGYLLMAQSKPLANHFAAAGWTSAAFWIYLVAACMVGLGTAIFKPAAHGTIAKGTDEHTASLGWGVFYWVVNIGAALSPMLAAWLRKDQATGQDFAWHRVFYGAIIISALAYLPTIFLYREPAKPEQPIGQPKTGPLTTFGRSILTISEDLRLVAFLLISSCFWLMFMLLWDLLPNFINEWVNTVDVAPYFAWFSDAWLTGTGTMRQVKPEMLINIDAITILILVIPLSYLIGKMRKLTAMVVGMTIALIGFLGAGSTGLGWVCCLMVFVFAIGELICSPTFSAYVGLIAPPDKKALYMGYSNIPGAIGWGVGNLISGPLYDWLSSKVLLARDFMAGILGPSGGWVNDPELLPQDRVIETMVYLGDGGNPTLLKQAAQQVHDKFAAMGDLTADQFTQRGEELLAAYDKVIGTVPDEARWQATDLLWNTYHPYWVWYVLGMVGLIGIIGMIVFYRRSVKSTLLSPPSAEISQT